MSTIDLDAIIEAAELAVYTKHHGDQCACALWPADCVTWPGGAKAVLFSVNAHDIVTAAAPLIAVAERLRPVPDGPWRAFVHDPSGWVHDDPEEALREIFDDDTDGRITVCCGTALPVDDGEGNLRMEGTYDSSDIFVEIDLTDCEDYEQGVEAWKRAQAAADGLNRMAGAESPVEATNHA